MKNEVDLNAIYAISDDVVSREIEGEIILVPLVAGIGDLEDELFSLNETGRVIWERLDGKKRLKEVIEELRNEFEASPEEIKKDVVGLIGELIKRKMIIHAEKI